tara:strand:- start:29 stop:187 length:159 start_codon:yes stop_codon:yes gene_type:complete
VGVKCVELGLADFYVGWGLSKIEVIFKRVGGKPDLRRAKKKKVRAKRLGGLA